jgi:hypothetical protein
MCDDTNLCSRDVALRRAQMDFLEFDAHFRKVARGWKLKPSQDDFLSLVWDAKCLKGRPLLSNHHVRYAGTQAMVDAMIAFEAEHQDRDHYLGTFCWDEGLTWEDRPYVDIPALQLRVYKGLRKLGLSGFTVTEVDVLRPLHDGPGQRLVFHVHCVCWTAEGKTFEPCVSAEKLMGGGGFPNALDVPSVQFKKIVHDPTDYARVGAYFLKLRAHAKNRVPRENGEYRLRKTRVGFTPPSAMRLVEVLSHISIFDVVRGVGPEGSAFVRSWKVATQAALGVGASRSDNWFDLREDVDAQWTKIRKANGSLRYAACTIITSSNRRVFKHRQRTPADTAYLRVKASSGADQGDPA